MTSKYDIRILASHYDTIKEELLNKVSVGQRFQALNICESLECMKHLALSTKYELVAAACRRMETEGLVHKHGKFWVMRYANRK